MSLRPIGIGRLFGFRITVNPTFLLLLALLSLNIALRSSNFLVGLAVGIAGLLLVFSCVLAHELAHSLTARRLGVQIAEIELHFFGGSAKLLSAPSSSTQELLITAAGPLSSLALAGLFALLGRIWSDPVGVIDLLTHANLMLGTFNLVPAFPMDGGRLLRAALVPRLGMLRATRVAAWISRGVAIAAVPVALIPIGLDQREPFLAALALFIWMLASRELRLVELLEQRKGMVEVYDRTGRLLAPPQTGGWSEESHRLYWSEAPSTFAPPADSPVQRIAMVRGPDGRLWIITER